MLCNQKGFFLLNQELNVERPVALRWAFASFLVIGFLAISSGIAAHAQAGFASSWEQRVRKTVAGQPGWPVPVVTPSSGLVQLVRFAAVRQITSTHAETWIYGNGKGFDFIPWYKTEVDIALPSYI